MVAGDVVREILAAFRREIPATDIAFDDVEEILGVEWQFSNGAKLWLDLGGDNKAAVKLYWRNSDTEAGHGQSLSIPVDADVQ